MVVEALNFPIPLVEVEPGIFALELFHGPTLAFKDVGARVMARLMAALHRGDEPLTILAATSGDTGSAVAHAFHGVPNTRVVILYPDGRVSPTQEAQLTMFNGERGERARLRGRRQLRRLPPADARGVRRRRAAAPHAADVGELRQRRPAAAAVVYYFHARGAARSASARHRPRRRRVLTPSGNFGNLTAGLMAKRAGLPIARFVAATNVNDVVPAYLATGRFEPRASVPTLANAMDVGHPSNFERMLWLYNGDLDAMRRDVAGCRFSDDEVRATIKRVYETRGYLLDPHSAIALSGADGAGAGRAGARRGRSGVFLATAHPAKFAEIVEPIIGRAVEKPAPLAQALARPRHIIRIDAVARRREGHARCI